ncbi:MAG: DUF6338 family protein [Terracidiphilus sp.]
MDIDLSKVVLFLLAVLPGYLARRGSDRVLPRTQRKTGATEEIAEFLIYSVIVHFVLTLIYCCFSMLAGYFYKHSAIFFLGEWLKLSPSDLLKRLYETPSEYLAIYLCLSLMLGWFLGVNSGLIELWHLTERVFRLVVSENSGAGRIFWRYFERFIITGRPIIYDALFPDLDDKGKRKDVYVELVLKENQGSVTGRVTSFSIANDEENHKLIFLVDVYRKMPGSGQYEKLDTDGMLVDIADAITLQIKQV